MARLMRMADDAGTWGNEGGSGRPSAARRNWGSAVWMVAGTLAVAVVSYSLSLKVANERREMEKLSRQNVALESELKALDAELRVRMRMPQLQRWNDGVLGLVPISATQYLDSPVRLTSYGKPLASELPQAQLAVRDVAPVPAAAQQPRLVSAEVPPKVERQPRPVQAIAPQPVQPAAPQLVQVSARAAAAPGIARPAAEAPADLLQQVEMTFGAAPARNP